MLQNTSETTALYCIIVRVRNARVDFTFATAFKTKCTPPGGSDVGGCDVLWKNERALKYHTVAWYSILNNPGHLDVVDRLGVCSGKAVINATFSFKCDSSVLWQALTLKPRVDLPFSC